MLPRWYFRGTCVFSLQSCIPVKVNGITVKQVDRSVYRAVQVWSLLWTHCGDPCYELVNSGAPLSAPDVPLSPPEAVLSSLLRVRCPLFVLELRAWWPDIHRRWGDPGDPEGRGVVDREHRYQNWNLPLQLRPTKRSRCEFIFWELTRDLSSQFYSAGTQLFDRDFEQRVMCLTEKKILGSLSAKSEL